MTDLKKLASLCPPPADGRRYANFRDEWGELPSDYRRLVETYGVGCFDEFLWIYGDVEGNPNLDIRTRSAAAQSDLMEHGKPSFLASIAARGVSLNDLIKWGATDSGDWLLWMAVGSPDSWPTLILEVRQRDILVVPRSATGVILDLLTGELTASIFPEDFPGDRPSFSVNPYTE